MKNIKKTLYKIFWLLLSVFMVIYLVAAGILFYLGPLDNKKIQKLLANYPAKIVVSLATNLNPNNPDQNNQLKLTLDSILQQSIKPDKIYINFYKIPAIIPDWFKNYPNLIINETKNYGTATKLIAVLKQETDPDTIIITVNDNIIYSKYIIKDLIKNYLPGFFYIPINMVITGYGENYLFDQNFNIIRKIATLRNKRQSLTVASAGGVAYKRKFFKNDIFLLANNIAKDCLLTEDIFISSYLIANNINILNVVGISYNKILNTELSNYVNFSNHIHCLVSARKVASHSNTIYNINLDQIIKYYLVNIYYNFLNTIISIIPFMKKFIMYYSI